MYSDYNYIQRQLQENSCLELDTKCTNNTKLNLKEYCSYNDNLLTEDICYHWYVNNIYDYNNNSDDIYTQNDKDQAITALNTACDNYPYHPKCNCVSEINRNNYDKMYSSGSTYNHAKAYPYYCIFNSCQKHQANPDPKHPSPFIPKFVYDDDTECPKNVCANILNENLITLANGSVLNIQNICNNQNDKDDKDEKDEKDNKDNKDDSSSASIFDVFAGKLGIEVNTLYVIIGVFSMIMLVLIIMIVYYIKQINRKKDWQYRVKAARHIKNNTSK